MSNTAAWLAEEPAAVTELTTEVSCELLIPVASMATVAPPTKVVPKLTLLSRFEICTEVRLELIAIAPSTPAFASFR